MASVSILRECSCGASPSQPNWECERCRMVYTILQVAEMRALQEHYFATRKAATPHEAKNEALKKAKSAETYVDKLIARLTEPAGSDD